MSTRKDQAEAEAFETWWASLSPTERREFEMASKGFLACAEPHRSPAFDALVNKLQVTPELRAALYDHERGPKIAETIALLGQREADRIGQLAPDEQQEELARLGAAFEPEEEPPPEAEGFVGESSRPQRPSHVFELPPQPAGLDMEVEFAAEDRRRLHAQGRGPHP